MFKDKAGQAGTSAALRGLITAFEVVDSVLIVVAVFCMTRPPATPMALSRRLAGWLAGPPLLAGALLANVAYHFILKSYLRTPPWAAGDESMMGASIAWLTLAICVQPAIFEELFFRHLTLGHLRGVMGVHAAVWVSSLIFGLAHLGAAQHAYPYLDWRGARLRSRGQRRAGAADVDARRAQRRDRLPGDASLIGTIVESKRRWPPSAIMFLVIAACCALLALVNRKYPTAFWIGAALFGFAAIARLLLGGGTFRLEFAGEYFDVHPTTLRIRYEDLVSIRSCGVRSKDAPPLHYPFEIVLDYRVIQVPARLTTPSREVEEFLLSKLPPIRPPRRPSVARLRRTDAGGIRRRTDLVDQRNAAAATRSFESPTLFDWHPARRGRFDYAAQFGPVVAAQQSDC